MKNKERVDLFHKEYDDICLKYNLEIVSHDDQFTQILDSSKEEDMWIYYFDDHPRLKEWLAEEWLNEIT